MAGVAVGMGRRQVQRGEAELTPELMMNPLWFQIGVATGGFAGVDAVGSEPGVARFTKAQSAGISQQYAAVVEFDDGGLAHGLHQSALVANRIMVALPLRERCSGTVRRATPGGLVDDIH